MKFKALVFDLDGTLCNTDAVHFPTWMEVLRPHGFEVDREFYDDRLAGRVNADVVDDLLPDLSEDDRQELIDAEESGSRRRTEEVGALPGLHELLEKGREHGLKLALVTNSVQEDAAQILAPLGLEDTFDSVVFPREVDETKPAPDPYGLALERMGLEAGDAVAFEDSTTGAESASRAGITTVGIARSYDPGELREAGADLVIGDFADRALYEMLDG